MTEFHQLWSREALDAHYIETHGKVDKLIHLIDLGHNESWHSLSEWNVLKEVRDALVSGNFWFFDRSED